MKKFSILAIDHDDTENSVGGSIEIDLKCDARTLLDIIFECMADERGAFGWRRIERFPETDKDGKCTPGQQFGDDD